MEVALKPSVSEKGHVSYAQHPLRYDQWSLKAHEVVGSGKRVATLGFNSSTSPSGGFWSSDYYLAIGHVVWTQDLRDRRFPTLKTNVPGGLYGRYVPENVSGCHFAEVTTELLEALGLSEELIGKVMRP